MVVRVLALGLLLAGCAGSGGGDDNTKRGGADSVTGPGVTVIVTCESTADRNVGDTMVNVDVNCPADSSNTTTGKEPVK